MLGSPSGSKRPNAKAPIKVHQRLGELLKELYSAMEYNKKGLRAISTVKFTLDNWIQLEYTSREELTDEVFFQIYYGDTNHPSDPWPTDRKKSQLKRLVKDVRILIREAYHNCAPIQVLNKKLDVAIKAIENWPLNRQVKGLMEVKGQISRGTLIYLKNYNRKPAVVLSHDTINNLIRCYGDSGISTVEREEITVARKQSKAKKFCPMRLTLPYGKWHCEQGIEILFNRDYIPIWMKDVNGKVQQVDPNIKVIHIDEQEFYFSDKSAPWAGDKSTEIRCTNILNSWNVLQRSSILMEELREFITNGNTKNFKFLNH
ncbi:DUF5623 domain-containing protein [Sphingobacterium populi]|nr:DUF5623 domain-containing protein [Sphingobacterium sp. CFCC 11742]